MIKLLLKCQKHKGPLMNSNIDLINKMSEEQIITEAKYLKASVHPNLKLKVQKRII